MRVYLPIIVFFLLFSVAEAQYYGNRIIVKFTRSSEELYEWTENSRSGEIAAFKGLIGPHKSFPFVRERLLDMLAEKSKGDTPLGMLGRINSLSRIAVIEYENEIDPLLLARKLSAFPFVEYAEPMPQHKIFAEPNDPKRNGQYYLENINVYEAWDLIDTNQRLKVAIVDTGIDYDHEDLQDNIWVNPGEDGTDENGNSRRDNGIDDDGNGFVDDWRGWDFAASSDTTTGQDNDPHPGHRHGTHVGGITGAVTDNHLGIASVGRYVKLIPVKAGPDNPLSTSITNGYDGLLYAGIIGADVVNCSWGGTNRSQAEKEVIDNVLGLGCVIVAACGNYGTHQPFYPAAYEGVISVAALNSANEKAIFSNYDETVDVSAPGDDILSTVPNDSYDFMSGTSMAAPVVTGVAALTKLAHPDMTNEQIAEQVRVTCDNIYDLNSDYKGLLGNGKVNALRAVSEQNTVSIKMISYDVEDENGDGILDEGELVEIHTVYKNVLSPVKNIYVKAYTDSYFFIPIERDSLYLGDMQTGDTVSADGVISFHLPQGLTYDYTFKVKLQIRHDDDIITEESITLFANPSYRNLDKNNITTTLNSRGNIGFNDYAFNLQGVGFRYKGSQNINFEGGLMIGSGYNRLSNCVRGRRQTTQDRDFVSYKILTLYEPGDIAALEAKAEFADAHDSAQAGVYVFQNAYQFTDDDAKDIVFVTYDIVNQTLYYRDSVYAGLFFDWDIGPGGTDNKVEFDYENQFGLARNVKDSTLPLAGVKIVTAQPTNFYAIDNAGNSQDTSIGIYNGFSKSEKWLTLSSGIKRPESTVTDASMVISAGPMRMLPWDTVRVTFALFAGYTKEELKTTARKAREVADRYGLSDNYYPEVPEHNLITNVYPNPVRNGVITVNYTIVKSDNIKFEIYDLKGRCMNFNYEIKNHLPGRFSFNLNAQHFAGGMYMLIMSGKNERDMRMIYIER